MEGPRGREPELSRGEWLKPAAGLHSYPPPKRSRFDPPPRRCPRCELVSRTDDARCPVCSARFTPTLRRRALGWRPWRRSG